MSSEIKIENVLSFWFSKSMNKHWFSSTPEIDQQIANQYNTLWEKAKNGELKHWKTTSNGCLALCIILDQLPLNMFRNKVKSFETEQQAVAITKYAIKNKMDNDIENDKVSFLYMPLMHSEDNDDQDLCVKKFSARNLEHNLRFAKHHRDIVRKYGRFPHRNKILGRKSSQAEIDYLNSDKAFTG